MRHVVLPLFVLLLASQSSLCALHEWPPNQSWIRKADEIRRERGEEAASGFLDGIIRQEMETFLSSDLVLVGTVQALRCYELTGKGDIWTEITVDVEECLKGDCQKEFVSFSMRGGTFDGTTLSVNSRTPPGLGQRYLFGAHWWSGRGPRVLIGGNPYQRIPHDPLTGQIPKKGVSFVSIVELLQELLEERKPRRLFEASDAVFAGTVENVRFDRKGPPESGDFSQERNHAVLIVEQTLKGRPAVGETVRMALPYKLGGVVDVPRVEAGDRALFFLRSEDDGWWTPMAGSDSALELSDGRVEGHGSLWELLDAWQQGEERLGEEVDR
jgi:hypothetical protein